MKSNVNLFSASDRNKWREYLAAHFETEAEVWFVFPLLEANEPSISYNDAVEEALCFGWIDSTNRHWDENCTASVVSRRAKPEVPIRNRILSV